MTWSRIRWTREADAELARQVAAGASQAAIARAVGVSVLAAENRCRCLGLAWPSVASLRRVPAPAPTAPTPAQRSFDPLPAGHPVSWGAITAGTWLAGSPYP